jgi:hypothetical protein
MDELRRLGVGEFAELSQAMLAEAEAFGGDPFRALEIASGALQTSERLRPLLTRVAGAALARLGETGAATRELTQSLRSARERGAEYDVAAAIDALDATGSADPKLLKERDAIMRQLKIDQLLPTLAAR